MSKNTRLQKALTPLSKSQNWEQSKREWEVLNVFEDEKASEVCACDKEHIRYCCEVRNIITYEQALLGCVCTDHLFGVETVKISRVIKKLKKAPDTIPVDALLEHTINRKILNDWEIRFLYSVAAQKYLSSKQFAKLLQINEKIIKCTTKKVADANTL